MREAWKKEEWGREGREEDREGIGIRTKGKGTNCTKIEDKEYKEKKQRGKVKITKNIVNEVWKVEYKEK